MCPANILPLVKLVVLLLTLLVVPSSLQYESGAPNFGCAPGHFRDGTTCHKLLSCQDKDAFVVKEELPVGYVKRLYRSQWKGIDVVYSVPRYEHTVQDFLHGIQMLRAFQTSARVVQLIGYCEEAESVYLATRFYKHGSADKVDALMSSSSLVASKRLDVRFALGEDYISILEFLHDSPLGVRVMCDSNDLMKTLSQFVVSDDHRLLLLDVDALPQVHRGNNTLIKCGHKELYGDFVAPEQLWPFEVSKFDDSRMPGYDEKTDIWKIPDMLQYLLGTSNAAYRLKLHLFETFRRCKEDEPSLRPDATYIKDVYTRAVSHEKRLKVEL